MSDIGVDSLNEMRLGAGVWPLGVACFPGVVIMSPALTLQRSAGLLVHQAFGLGGYSDLPKEIVQIAFHQRYLIPDIGEHG